MEKQTRQQVAKALEGKSFDYGVDLGCGYGEVGDLLKEHCSHLVGVDKDTFRAVMSGCNKFYDELIKADVRTFEIPPQVQAVFLFDLVEHVSPVDGVRLFGRIGGRFCIVTTPSKFETGALNGHVCLWSEDQLQLLGFRTETYSAGFFRDKIYGKKIIGVRE